MNRTFYTLFYVLLYFQINTVLKPFVYDNYECFQGESIQFYPVIQSANIFILSIFSVYTLYLITLSRTKNIYVLALSIIYIKYVMDSILYNNTISIYQYEFRQSLMWGFTTPLILKLYADMNHITMIDIHSYIHIASNIIHIFMYPFRKTGYNGFIICALTVMETCFIYRLCAFNAMKYTKYIICIWCMFSFITGIEILHIFNVHDIQICFLLSDMIAKLTVLFIVNDHEEQMEYVKDNMDLQAITLLSHVKKTIKTFESTNILTKKCRTLMCHLENEYTKLVPVDKTILKLELLRKILPLEMEDNYLTQTNDYKSYNFICVLFTDIVSYTELAKRYDDSVIFRLLNNIYTVFDEAVVKYSNLQKIETIGDAYMVVGDIYNQDTQTNVRNIVLLSIEFMRLIKTIPTPDGVPLQLRIGIHLGKVTVGILGNEIPRLCVVGNTVNVASRLQSTAEPDGIQMSRHVYEFASELDLGIEEYHMKENVYLKNLGSVTTYNILSTAIGPDSCIGK